MKAPRFTYRRCLEPNEFSVTETLDDGLRRQIGRVRHLRRSEWESIAPDHTALGPIHWNRERAAIALADHADKPR